MPEAKTARNIYIATHYSRADRNGQILADRFGISLGRVHQIVKEYSVKEKDMVAKYTGRLPVTMIEPHKLDKVKQIASSFGVPLAVIIRWALDAYIIKHEHGESAKEASN